MKADLFFQLLTLRCEYKRQWSPQILLPLAGDYYSRTLKYALLF